MSANLKLAVDNGDGGGPLTLQHNLEVEQALLGALLLDNGVYTPVREILKPDDFREAVHARIFETTCKLIDDGKPATPISLMPLFRNDQTLLELGGNRYIAQIAGAAVTALSAVDHARIIAECARERRVIEVGHALSAGSGRAGTEGLNQLVAEAVEALLADSEPTGRGGTESYRLSLPKAADKVITRVNSAYQSGKPTEKAAYPGSDILAATFGGFRKKRLYTVGARTSIGKTSVVTSWLLRTTAMGFGVLLFELEMEITEIAERCLSDITLDGDHPVPYERISRDDLSEKDILALLDAQEKFAALPFRIDDKSGLTIAQVRAVIQQEMREMAKKGQHLDVVCIDHMGLLRASDRYSGNKVAETEEISAAMKQMAKDFDLAIVNVMQLNRQVEARENKAPTLADLRWSGAVEQDSDVVLLLHRPAYYIEREYCATADEEIDRADRLQSVEHLLEVNVAKNRGGPCPQLKFHCDLAYSAVRDMEGRT
jgi:replicative DNA helicase